jgi:arylsulfatase A-like enzyme
MAGKIIEDNVQEIDILPTILDLTEQPIPDYLAGRTFKDMLVSSYIPDTPLHEMMFFEACADLRKKALIKGRWKLIHTGRQWRDNPFEWELYDLVKDPKEKNDLVNVNIIASGYMKNILTLWAQAQDKLKTLGQEEVEKALTKEDIEEFRALGYIR